MKLKDELDKCASLLLTKAAKKDTPLQESIDTFKAVTAYYAAQQRDRKKSGEPDEPDDDGFSFTDEVLNGGGREKLPARRTS